MSSASLTSSSIFLLLPLTTASKSLSSFGTSLSISAADVVFPACAVTCDASMSPESTESFLPVTLFIYLVSDSGLFIRRSAANIECIRRSCDGFAIAIVSPWLMAILIKLLFTNILSGSPKEIFERPHAVATPISFLQYEIVSIVSLAAFLFAPIVATRPSTTTSSFVRPNSYALSRIV